MTTRIQLTTDGHKVYADAVEGAFGMQVDYAMLIKLYGAPAETTESRYSPAKCIGRTGHTRQFIRSGMMATVPQVTEREGGFCPQNSARVKENIKSPDHESRLSFRDLSFGLLAAAAHGVSPAAESLLALGALTIHRSGLEAALFQPALDLVFREADSKCEIPKDLAFREIFWSLMLF